MNRKISTILIIFLISINTSLAYENKILFRVNNEIITSVDILNEINYLNSLNENLKNLKKEKIFQIAKNSLIREKVKEITLLKIFEEIKLNEEDYNRSILNNYSYLNINNIDELNQYLKKFNLTIKKIKKKISINALWNQIIYDKFSKNVKIDVKKLKKEILKDNKQKEFLLSELVFNLEINESLEKKFDLISKSILDDGFENSALTYSISDSATNGGKLGWVKESSINKKIINEVYKLKINEHTTPITIPGGFLILKLNETKVTEKEIDLDKELQTIIRVKTNDQLNQFSNIFLNKVKKDIVISEF
jgi:peptidyl-prolyl cis-trans isomerase SurA